MIEGSFRGRLHSSVVTLNTHTHTQLMFIISAVLLNVINSINRVCAITNLKSESETIKRSCIQKQFQCQA